MAMLEMRRTKGTDDLAVAAADVKKPKKAPKQFVAAPATVNLLSPEVLAAVELRRLRRLFMVLAVGLVVAIIAAWFGQAALISSAESKKTDEEARTTALTSQLQALTPVKIYYGAIDLNQSTIQTTMASEVLTSKIIEALRASAPNGLSIGNVGLTVNVGSTAAVAPAAGTVSTCPNPNPFATSTAAGGCLSVDGVAESRAVVGEWIRDLLKDSRFTEVFVPTATADENGNVTFAATIGLSPEVYSRRYENLDFVKGQN